ncbi:hypothetical protein HY448_02495 [Candidatus Pacearchaeota archaeon]|nr:hypothetical protein [Candidatus Pacearchaeota archaeon]
MEKERIKMFEQVRDIPYYISVGKEKGFDCSVKAEMLKKLLDLKSRSIICEFRWEDLKLPKEILEIYHENPEYHEFLEVYIPEKQKFVIVDPTWDNRLKSILPINEWDGLNNTRIAVPAKKIYSPEESEKKIQKMNNPEET